MEKVIVIGILSRLFMESMLLLYAIIVLELSIYTVHGKTNGLFLFSKQ